MFLITTPLCVYNRGHDFRTAFDKLGGLRALTDAPFMALTASAPAGIQSKIIESLHLKDPVIVSYSPTYFCQLAP